ncbi:glucokinase [Methyloligella sp. GL2]|nr:glucokinase [Methyloligella sp. GL2]
MGETAPRAEAQALVADIGGTNARFALAHLETLEISNFRTFSCAEHGNLAEAAALYLAELPQAPHYGAFAVAAPVTGESVEFTNSPWSFSRRDFCAEAGLEGLLVLNDFEALALSLPHLDPVDLSQIGGEEPLERGTKVVLGPGTGLGAASLVWSETGWIAVPGEGGHINLAPAHTDQIPLLSRMMANREHLSAERILSGPGLCDLYRYVAEERGAEPTSLHARDIVARASDNSDPIAVETLEHFIAWLGSFAGDMAMMLGARGGVYLGGGVSLRILDFLRQGKFRHYFEAKGRMRDKLLKPIPIYVIGAEAPALQGAAAALRAEMESGMPAGL